VTRARRLFRTLHLDEPLAWALLVLGACALLSQGCGASAIRINATASTVAAAALEPARRIVSAEADAAIAACATSPDRPACLTAAEQRSTALGLGFDSVRLAVVAHREGLEVAVVAGDSDAVGRILARAWALVLREYEALLAMLAAAGMDVSALMALPEVE
jgi:hypothetical protein